MNEIHKLKAELIRRIMFYAPCACTVDTHVPLYDSGDSDVLQMHSVRNVTPKGNAEACIDGRQLYIKLENLPVESLGAILEASQRTTMDARRWCPKELRDLIVPGCFRRSICNATGRLEELLEDKGFRRWVKSTKFEEDAMTYVDRNGDWIPFAPAHVKDGVLVGEDDCVVELYRIRECCIWWLLLSYYDKRWLKRPGQEVFKHFAKPGDLLPYVAFDHCDTEGDMVHTAVQRGTCVTVVLRSDNNLVAEWVDDDGDRQDCPLSGIDYASIT